MPNQIATWNPERDCWETGVEDIFGHSDVYSETWPTSGMTRNGVAYALPTWEPHTTASACSSSPPVLKTPMTSDSNGAAPGREFFQLREQVLTLPTPEAKLAHSGPDYARANRKGSGGHDLTTAIHLLPTGAPTPPPSTDGNPSWEDVPLPLPSSPNAESTGSPPASPNG